MSGDPDEPVEATRMMPARFGAHETPRGSADLDEVATQILGKRRNDPVARLTVIDGPGIGHSRPIYPGTNSLGREAGNRILLDFGDDSISRNGHAVILVDAGGQMRILDGGKVNPIHVNSVMVADERPLEVGDVIDIGQTQLRVEAV